MDKPYPGVEGVLDLWIHQKRIDHTHKDALLSEVTDDIERLRADHAATLLQNEALRLAIQRAHGQLTEFFKGSTFDTMAVPYVKAAFAALEQSPAMTDKPKGLRETAERLGMNYVCTKCGWSGDADTAPHLNLNRGGGPCGYSPISLKCNCDELPAGTVCWVCINARNPSGAWS